MKYTLLAIGLLASVNGFAANETDLNWESYVKQRCEDFCKQNGGEVLTCKISTDGSSYNETGAEPAVPPATEGTGATSSGNANFSWSISCTAPTAPGTAAPSKKQ